MEKKCADFYDILNSRESVRTYSTRPVENRKLERLYETLRRSQSAANSQPWHFIVLQKSAKRDIFDDQVLYKDAFKTAPVIIVACAEPAAAWVRKSDKTNYAVVDVTIAVTEMISAATAEGLGTCWIAAFEPEKVKEQLHIPEDIVPVGLVTLGYPENPVTIVEKPNRKKTSEIIRFDRW